MNAITLKSSNLLFVEYISQRVMTFVMIDEVYQRPHYPSRKTFNRHRRCFIKRPGKKLKVLRPAVDHITALIQLTIPGLEA